MASGTIVAPLIQGLSGLSGRTVNYAAQGFVLGLPPQRDVGYVTDHAYVTIYLWNGTVDDAVLISVSGDAEAEGITWDVATPVVVVAKGSQRVVLDVSIDGPLVIDALVTFVSSCNTIVLHLTGTRAPHLSGDVGYLFVPHNWEEGLHESLAWKTEVLIAHDRTEQRIQLRTHPRRNWDLRLLVSGAMRRKLDTWLGLRKTRYLFAPVWRDVSWLETGINAGETTIAIKPEFLDYAVGRWVAVFDGEDHFEIRTVTGIGANFIAIDSGFEQDWPAGSLVAPCRYGLALEQRRVTRFTEEVADWRIRFEAQGETLMPEVESPELYRELPVCPFVPDWDGGEEGRDNKWVRLDNDTGVIEYDIQSIEPVLTREVSFLLIGRDRIDLFLRFLFGRAGRKVPFWLAGADRGFELAAPAAAGDTTLTIDPIDYEYALSGSPARSHIELATIDGARIRRMIVGVETLPSGHEKLTLDSGLPVAVASTSLNRCAWLELCRLDADAIDLHWVGWDCLEVKLPVVALP